MTACTCHDPRVFGHQFPCGPLFPLWDFFGKPHWDTRWGRLRLDQAEAERRAKAALERAL